MNEILSIAGIGIITSALVIVLKQYKPEFAFGVILISGIIITVYTVFLLSDFFGYCRDLISLSGMDGEKTGILLRCAGICIVSKIASETCRDCGEMTVSSRIEFAGKAVMIICALPLFREITGIIRELMGL